MEADATKVAEFLEWMRSLPVETLMRIHKDAHIITVTVAGKSVSAPEEEFLKAWRPPFGNVRFDTWGD